MCTIFDYICVSCRTCALRVVSPHAPLKRLCTWPATEIDSKYIYYVFVAGLQFCLGSHHVEIKLNFLWSKTFFPLSIILLPPRASGLIFILFFSLENNTEKTVILISKTHQTSSIILILIVFFMLMLNLEICCCHLIEYIELLRCLGQFLGYYLFVKNS
jgi:hypothetical protein